LTITAETVDDTVKGDTYRTKKVTFLAWATKLDCWWDETDTSGQGAMVAGAEVTVSLFPEGDASTDKYYTGTAIVTELEITSDLDGIVEAALSLEGNGAVTLETVT
jgi:hypothetical protein